MLSNRFCYGLAAFLLAATASINAFAQDHDLEGMAIAQPADVRPYDNWAEPRNGLFFNFDGLYWHISPPAKTSIGDPTLTPTVFVGPALDDSFVETNSIETPTQSVWKWGDRMELGYVEGHNGFIVTSLSTQSQTEETAALNAFVVFNDPAFGPNGSHFLDTVLQPATLLNPAIIGETPVNFSSIYVQSKSRLQGVEALYMYRMDELHLGGQLEFTVGGRYFELKDQFWVNAQGGNIGDSYWNTKSHNEIAGPEIGARCYQPWGRFALSAESRFTAGINAQAIEPGRPARQGIGRRPKRCARADAAGRHQLHQLDALHRVLADHRASGRGPHATDEHHLGQSRVYGHFHQQCCPRRGHGRLHGAQHGHHAEPGRQPAERVHPRPESRHRVQPLSAVPFCRKGPLQCSSARSANVFLSGRDGRRGSGPTRPLPRLFSCHAINTVSASRSIAPVSPLAGSSRAAPLLATPFLATRSCSRRLSTASSKCRASAGLNFFSGT